MFYQILYKFSKKIIGVGTLLALFLISTLLSSSFIFAQDENKNLKSVPEGKSIVLKEKNDKTIRSTSEQSHLENQKRHNFCKIYKGKFISYYHDIFWVDTQCNLHLLGSDQAYKVSKKYKILEAPQELIALFQMKSAYKQVEIVKSEPCKWNGRYLTYDFDRLFLVEQCKLREFPDWASFERHRGSLSRSGRTFFPVKISFFLKFKKGEPMPSVLSVVSKDFDQEKLEALPQEKVCFKYLGKVLSYVDGLYRVVKSKKGKGCEKIRVDSEKYTLENTSQNQNYIELSSKEFLSIPERSNISKDEK